MEPERPHAIDRIVAASRALLASEGVAGLSYRAVAREAGVSAGTVAYYFESRADLLEAALDRHHDRLAELAAPLLALTPDQLGANLDAVGALVRFAFESRDDVRLRLATWISSWELPSRRSDAVSALLVKATARLGSDRWSDAERRVIMQALVYATQRFAASSSNDLRAVTGLEQDDAARELVEKTLTRVVERLFT